MAILRRTIAPQTALPNDPHGQSNCLQRHRIPVLLALLAVLLATIHPTRVTAQTPDPHAQTKAAYIINFTNFVTWPDEVMSDGNAPFVITILGEDPFGPTLDMFVQGRTVGEKPVVIQRVQTMSVDSIQRSHILYVSNSMQDNLRWIITNVQHRPIFTLAEMPIFMQHGGILNFVTEGNRVQFEINVSAVQRANLSVNARLLRLARQYRDRR